VWCLHVYETINRRPTILLFPYWYLGLNHMLGGGGGGGIYQWTIIDVCANSQNHIRRRERIDIFIASELLGAGSERWRSAREAGRLRQRQLQPRSVAPAVERHTWKPVPVRNWPLLFVWCNTAVGIYSHNQAIHYNIHTTKYTWWRRRRLHHFILFHHEQRPSQRRHY
jgi:hypothetical protein